MEFTDNLEDIDAQALANIFHDSDSERPTKVAARKHNITHIPRRPKNAKSASQQRLRGLLADRELVNQNHVKIK